MVLSHIPNGTECRSSSRGWVPRLEIRNGRSAGAAPSVALPIGAEATLETALAKWKRLTFSSLGDYIAAIVPSGSAQLAGAAPGLQIQCGALTPSRVGSIPMHFRHFYLLDPSEKSCRLEYPFLVR